MSSGKTPNFKLNEWDYSDKPSMQEFNRDNAIVDAELKRLWDSKADTTRRAWYFYVSKSGSDATADGTQANPFGTIQAAVDFAGSKVAGREKYVMIGDGIYEEAVYVAGFDKLIIRGVSGNRDSVIIKPPVKNNGVLLNGIAGCDIKDLTIRMPYGSSDYHALHVYGGSAYASNLMITSEEKVKTGVLFNMGASGGVYDSEISNCNYAIRAIVGSTLYTKDNSGSGNAIAHAAHGAIIFHEGTVPVADRMSAAAAGGQICS